MRALHQACLALIGVAMSVGVARAEVMVIVSNKNPTKSLNAEQASDIFLGKAAYFPKGPRAVPIDQNEGSPIRDDFYQKSCGKTSAQMKAHWAKMLFTGRGQPPVESGDSAAIKHLVAENPNLIGYIDRKDLDGSVKPLLILH
jgi:ABC-type phosphate transport system substrate-binding protein